MAALRSDAYPLASVNGDAAPHTMADSKVMEASPGGHGPVDDKAARDEEDMRYWGKRQQLKRNFGFLSMVGLVVTLMSTWEGMFSSIIYGLANGGPAGLVYGYLFSWIGTTAVIASMAELASAIPLAGGQLTWVSYLAPPKWSNFLSYMTGWVNTLGWIAGTASLAYIGATEIQGLLVLNYPNYVFHRWHGTLLFYGVMALSTIINTVLAFILPKIEGAMFITHVLGYFGVLIPLVYLSDHGTAQSVFATFVNSSGWDSNGLSFFIGLITAIYSFLGADASTHMAEEAHGAGLVVPRTMITSMALNGALGFGMLIALLFCAGNVTNALTSPTEYPFIAIFAQATGSNGGASGMTAVIIIQMISACVGLTATSSRMLWAFARDNGVPFASYIGYVEPRTQLPLYSISVVVVICLLLALINIASSTAFNALISLVVAGFYSAYLISISLILHRRFSGVHMRWGPWTMGRWGVYVNVLAIAYILIALFFSFWPGTKIVNAENMNWSIAVFAAVVIFSLIFWFTHGRRNYRGMLIETGGH